MYLAVAMYREIGGWGRVPFNEPYAPSLSVALATARYIFVLLTNVYSKCI